VVSHVERDPDSADELLSILAKPRERTTRADVERARSLFSSSSALDAVLDQMIELESAVLAAPALVEEPALCAVAAELMNLALSPIHHLYVKRQGKAL